MTQNDPSPILVFDVNETLLDITTLEPLFARLFGDRSTLRGWFAQLILYSQTMTLSGLYTPFGELGVGALRMVASIHGVIVADRDIEELRERMGSMPAHCDDELMAGGGRQTVPCLRIDEGARQTWLYESGDIIRYLEQRFIPRRGAA